MNSISIIGSGKVGSTVGMGFRQLGHHVIFHDVDECALEKLQKAGNETTSDCGYAIGHSSVSFICVPTPYKDGIDLRYLDSAIKELASALSNKSEYHLVVIKSTVVPTVIEHIVSLFVKSGQEFSDKVGLCLNPEFLTEINSTWTDDKNYERDFFTEDRIVIGEYDKKSGDMLEQLYKPVGIPIIRTDIKTASMIKYASNCMLATKISFWNEIFLICKKLGLDSQQVADVASMDPRIGKYGTIHGKAFGGKCLPKDLAAFICSVEESHNPILLKAVREINDSMAKYYEVRE